ncbi:hypothetical protein SCHPADRAFT_946006 [Schizopora paradoxa]|uniref:BTB domain-containing protein n=1 Tax=Schizopora paradoxa TaxID=27342 RepID=A0A0H2RAP0_9AGAM|nr:hypothetical protein SCHPADRAFT_946006 [Schizopora paradoxa]
MSLTPSDAIEERIPELHPDYTFDDADITLLSSDGVLFQVHSIIMRMVSTVFRDMFAMKGVEGDGPVALEESKEVLKTVLDVIYPSREVLYTIRMSHFRNVALAADKYDITIVTDFLKDRILGKHQTTREPRHPAPALKRYLLAWEFGWTSVTDELSSKTLSCDLNSSATLDLLLNGDAAAAKAVIDLHRKHRIWLYNAISVVGDTFGNNTDFQGTKKDRLACRGHIASGTAPELPKVQHSPDCQDIYASDCQNSWWKLKARMRNMLDVNASGEQFLEDSFFERPEIQIFTTSTCCNALNAKNEKRFRKYLQYIVDRVPKTNDAFREVKELYQNGNA